MPRNGYQLDLFNGALAKSAANVASIVQRRPFRYPGGKTWLVPRIQQWLLSLKKRPSLFIEPFAGGAIVGLTVAFERLADHVILVEIDRQVAAVWRTILDGDGEWLISKILSFDLTPETLREELAKSSPDVRERAFRAILKNRTFYGGIIAEGSGPLKRGERGRGVASRWYPKTLVRRIRDIQGIKDRISFVEGDGLTVIESHVNRRSAAFFIDPPYTAAGKRAGRRLYAHHEIDHAKLFETIAKAQGDFLMTYDTPDKVAELAARHGFQTQSIAMKNAHHARTKEFSIGRDLSCFNLS